MDSDCFRFVLLLYFTFCVVGYYFALACLCFRVAFVFMLDCLFGLDLLELGLVDCVVCCCCRMLIGLFILFGFGFLAAVLMFACVCLLLLCLLKLWLWMIGLL